MIGAILLALLVSVVIYALASLAVRKIPLGPEFVLIVWAVAVILIILVWWRVLAPALGAPPLGPLL